MFILRVYFKGQLVFNLHDRDLLFIKAIMFDNLALYNSDDFIWKIYQDDEVILRKDGLINV